MTIPDNTQPSLPTLPSSTTTTAPATTTTTATTSAADIPTQEPDTMQDVDADVDMLNPPPNPFVASEDATNVSMQTNADENNPLLLPPPPPVLSGGGADAEIATLEALKTTRKDKNLREFLQNMDEFAPIVRSSGPPPFLLSPLYLCVTSICHYWIQKEDEEKEKRA